MAASSRSPHSTRMHQAALHQPIDSTRWNAVVARDRAAAGAFVYAVRSTGVYCRPGCASRRPRRDRVTFFDTPDEAEGAGFRPCRRCRPRDVVGPDPWVERIRRACVYLANVDGHLPLASLARRLGGSPYHLQRNFKRIVGITPRQYAEACRLQRVKQRAARTQIGDRCHPGRRFRIEQPPLRAGRSEAGHDAVDVSARRRGCRRSGSRRSSRQWAACSSRPRRAASAGCRWASRIVSSGRRSKASTRTPASRAMLAGLHAGHGRFSTTLPVARRGSISPRHPGDGVPVAGLGGACRHPVRFDANVCGGGSGDRAAGGGPGRGARLRGQSGRACHSVSPRRAVRGRSRRLSVGSVAQAVASGFGAPPPGYRLES